jgi:outer membrane receptor protein involved in Fe transport
MAPRRCERYRACKLMRFTQSYRRTGLSLALASLTALPALAQQDHTCDDRIEATIPSGGWTAPLDRRVTLKVREIALRDALDRLTAASGVQLAYSSDFLPVDRRVCMAADQQPLGAVLNALLRGTRVQVLVVSGKVVLSPGASSTQPAEVPPQRVSVLDRVVVTGNAVAAPRRPLTIGIDIIDGEQLRRQAIGSLSQLLDQAVPGLWVWGDSPSSLVSQYGGLRGASSFGASAPKIYIDGVEVANPLLVTQLNPEVVDRVEVIRGPQGSALYGSDAISGVVNILTRHDGAPLTGTLVTVQSMAGAAQSDYASGLVPQHEQRVSVRAGTNVRSGGLAATFSQTGSLYPSSATRQIAATGDARIVSSNATYTATARFFDKSAGIGRNPLIVPLLPSTNPASGSGPSQQLLQTTANDQSVRQYTLSSNATFAADEIWTHTLLAGVDGYALDHIADGVGPFPSQLDSALRAARGNGDRYTLRASSVAHFGEEGKADGTLTFGLEESVLRQAATQTQAVRQGSGQYPMAVEMLRETWNHDTGILSQLTMSWQNSMYLSGGLRIERNDSFSGSNRYPLLPMIGVAVVRGLGEAELKWRVAYGKGIRPPQTPARSSAQGYTGGFYNQGLSQTLAALDPEVQAGYETGVELYAGRALTLQLTRFDQRVTGLIQNVAVGVDTFSRGPGTETRVRYQLQNVGQISNTGWEVQGNYSRGPLGIVSTYSTVDSRVQALANGYNGDLRVEDRMLSVPRHTGSLTVSWLEGKWFGALGATRAQNWINYDRLRLAQDYLKPGIDLRAVTGAQLRNYWAKYDGETHLRLTLSRDLLRGFTAVVVGDNLLGGQLGEPDNVTIRAGRTITGGLRASF